MGKLLRVTLVLSALLGFTLAGAGFPALKVANADVTYNCTGGYVRGGFRCAVRSGTCTPSSNPCPNQSSTTCETTTYTCPVATGTCPSGSSGYDNAALCQRDCTGSCVVDTLGVARCCTSGGGDGGDGGNAGGEPIKLTVPGSISTPLGDIPLDPTLFAQWLLNLGIGLGILISILFIIIGGYGVATSAGNPENLEKAKGQITAAITGLLFILLTSIILRTIGYIIGIDIKLFGI